MMFLLCCLLAATATQVRATIFGTCDCLDVALILDTSKSINDVEWAQLQSFLGDFIDEFAARDPPVDIVYAAVNFSKTALLVSNLDEFQSNEQFKAVLAGIVRERRKTRHNLGLMVVRDEVFTGAGGDRDDARCPDVAVMISDGYNFTGGDAVSVANDLMENGVTIVSVAIGNNQVREFLEEISSRDDGGNPLVVEAQFDQLISALEPLANMVCMKACPTTTTTTKPHLRGKPIIQTCCCGELFGSSGEYFPDRDTNCCAGVAYNFTEATCCEGYLYEGYPEETSLCCAGEAYDPQFYTCCNGYVSEASPEENQCCNFEPYNPTTHMCCGEGYDIAVQPRDGYCCGSQLYNPEYEVCCIYEVYVPSFPTALRCCGSTAYDPYEENCCDPATGTVMPSVGHFFYDYYGDLYNTEAECGTTTYRPLDQTCCCGKLYGANLYYYVYYSIGYTQCCGTDIIDMSYYVCCDAVMTFAINGDYDQENNICCGGDFISLAEDSCCLGKAFDGVGDCCGQVGVFDPSSELCCSGVQILDGDPATQRCCTDANGGSTVYTIASELCCDGEVQPGGPFMRCCGQTSYDTLWYNCCDGELRSRQAYRESYWCD